MRLSIIRLVGVMFVAPLLVSACEHPQDRRDPVPPGVSLDPPRQSPATGSLGLPGQDPAAPLPAGAEEPILTDTVPVPTERPAQPGQPAPGQPAPGQAAPAQPAPTQPAQPAPTTPPPAATPPAGSPP